MSLTEAHMQWRPALTVAEHGHGQDGHEAASCRHHLGHAGEDAGPGAPANRQGRGQAAGEDGEQQIAAWSRSDGAEARSGVQAPGKQPDQGAR